MKKIIVKPIATDEEFGKNYEGTWFDEKDVTQVIDFDADVYTDDGTGETLLAKFRKAVIPKDDVQRGWDAFRLLAIPSRNRGAAAGPIDLKGIYWSKRKPTQVNKWRARYIREGNKGVSKMSVNNVVASGVIGYYESTAFLDAACRMTGYTRKALKNYLHGIPFLKQIDMQFQKLVPEAHAKQLAAVKKQKTYQIDDTAFSTVTVNLNFRTALHKDAGDFKEGFGNLTVIEWGKYHGGYTILPRYKIGFDVRTGDFLAMDVHEWHTNTPMYETDEDKAFNKQLPNIQTRDVESGVVGSNQRFQRLTFVCYLREKLMECDTAKTEDYYQRTDFNLKNELLEAKQAEIHSLPIPGYTGTIEEAKHAIEHTSAGSAIRLAQTRKQKQKDQVKQTRKK
jgi:hypothetical protein